MRGDPIHFPGASIQLYESNVTNFLVLDAKDYIGGRVRSESFQGFTVAMGAGWIHMVQEDHMILQLAKKWKLKYAEDDYDIKKMSIRYGWYVAPG